MPETKSIKKTTTTKRATTKRATNKDLFAAYIDKIIKARKDSQKLISPYMQEDKPSLVINLIWEAIFDYFCRVDKEEISPSNLNTLAGVVQKLMSTSKDVLPKEKDINNSISAEALAEIEDKLNLL